jgi:hypothetical protein
VVEADNKLSRGRNAERLKRGGSRPAHPNRGCRGGRWVSGAAFSAQAQSGDAHIVSADIEHTGSKTATARPVGSSLLERKIQLRAENCTPAVPSEGHSRRKEEGRIVAEINASTYILRLAGRWSRHTVAIRWAREHDNCTPPRLKCGTRPGIGTAENGLTIIRLHGIVDHGEIIGVQSYLGK